MKLCFLYFVLLRLFCEAPPVGLRSVADSSATRRGCALRPSQWAGEVARAATTRRRTASPSRHKDTCAASKVPRRRPSEVGSKHYFVRLSARYQRSRNGGRILFLRKICYGLLRQRWLQGSLVERLVKRAQGGSSPAAATALAAGPPRRGARRLRPRR